MARKLVQLALLYAGLFLSSTVRADDCAALAGTLEDFLTIPKSSNSTCPDTYRRTVGASECILEKAFSETNPFLCSDFDTYFIGGPYRYTGGRYVTTPPVTPVTPIDAPVWQQPDLENTNTESYFVNSYNALVNITGRLNSITDYLTQDSNATRTEIRNQADMVADNNRIQLDYVRGSLSQIATNTDYKVQTILNRQVRLSDFELLFGEVNTALAEAKEAQEVSDAERDALGEEILTAVEDVKSQVVAVQGQIEDPFTREAKHDELLSAINNSSGGGGDGELTVSILGDISNTSQLQLGETMDGFQAVKTNIQNLQSQSNNNTDRIVNAVNNPTGLVTVTNELQAVGGRLDGLLGQGQGLSNQLGQQLDEIKTAIENDSGSGGGNDDDTETNQKLDDLIQAIALVAQNTGATNDNLVQASQNIQSSISASGQQVTDSINSLGEKLDGIGEGVDGIANALKPGTGQKDGPATCEGKDCWKAASWIESSYPDGVAGLWEARKDAFDRSGMKQYLNSLIPNIGGEGGLKPFELCFDMGFAHYGCHSFTIPPYVIAFIRLCFLIAAGFYCQRLVFGGA